MITETKERNLREMAARLMAACRRAEMEAWRASFKQCRELPGVADSDEKCPRCGWHHSSPGCGF